MPSVPTYQPGQVRGAPVPALVMPAGATPAAFGGRDAAALSDLGEGAQRAGYVAGQTAVDLQDRHNMDVVRDRYNQASLEATDYLAKEVFSKRGADAMTAAGGAKDRFADITKRYSDGLENDAQRRTFTQLWGEHVTGHLERVTTFAADQERAYRTDTISAMSQGILRNALLYRDPDTLAKADADITQNAGALAAMAGASPERKALDVATQRNHLYSTVAEAKLADDPTATLKFLSEHRDKFLPEAFISLRDKAERAVKQTFILGTAQRLASKPGQTDAGLIADIEGMKDVPDDQKALLNEAARTQWSIRKAAEADQARQAKEAAWSAFAKTGFLQVPDAVDGEERLRMLNVARETADRAAKAESSSDKATYNMLIGKVTDGTLAGENLWQYAGRLSTHDLSKFREWKDAMLKGGNKETEAFRKALNDATHEAGQLQLFKIGEEDTEPQARAKQDALNQYLGEYALRLQSVPDEKRTDWKTAKDIRDVLLAETVRRRGLFGSEDMHIPVLSTVNDYLMPDTKEGAPRQFQLDAQARSSPVATPGAPSGGPSAVAGTSTSQKPTPAGSNSPRVDRLFGLSVPGQTFTRRTIIPNVGSQAERDALPSGSLYVWTDGRTYRKP